MKVVEPDPARFMAVTVYVPASDIPEILDLVSVEVALGGSKLLWTMLIRFCVSFTKMESL